MPIILGIDPGQKGAIALLDTNTAQIILHDMPTYTIVRSTKKTHTDPHRLTKLCLTFGARPSHAWIEEVHSSPQMGVVGAFTFGEHYGVCLGVLGGLQVATKAVSPQRWKAAMKAPADKTLSRTRASELMPACAEYWQKTNQDGRAEAAMIALYGALQQGCPPRKPIRHA